MHTYKKNVPSKREVTDPPDKAFENILKNLVAYSEALKCYSDQIELSKTLEK